MKNTTIKVVYAILFVLAALGVYLLTTHSFDKTTAGVVIPSDTTVKKVDSITVRSGALFVHNPYEMMDIHTKDSTIAALQELVQQYKKELNSAVVIKTTTQIDAKGKTEIVRDSTLPIYDSVSVFPTYRSRLSDKWYDALMTMSKDSSILNLTVRGEYNVIIGKEKEKWYADVKNLSPYSSTDYVRALQIVPPTIKKTRWTVGPQAGYGYTVPNKATIYLGVGITYDLIKF